MGTPSRYLPSCSDEDVYRLFESLALVVPNTVSALVVTAAFHKVWAIESNPGEMMEPRPLKFVESFKEGQYILRVSGNHIPNVKTENELAIMAWLRSNTSIPVPDVLAFDTTINNPLCQEYTLMTRMRGVTGSDVYDTITDDQMDAILDQMVDYHLELYARPFNHVGGLRTSPLGSLVPGPVLDEYMWQVPEIKEYWPNGETFESLNPDSPDGYPHFVAWITAFMKKYLNAIEIHPSLDWLTGSDVAMLDQFVELINASPMLEKINGGLRYILAHRDMHFANMLLDADTHRIAGILDWEFAQVVPLPLWRRSFLWNGRQDADSHAQRDRLYARWEAKMKHSDLGTQYLANTEWQCPEQRLAFEICDYLRCIVEVCPRCQMDRPYKRWWNICVSSMEELGVRKTAG